MSKTDNTKTTPKAPASVPTPSGRRGLGAYLADVKLEIKKIAWPTPLEATRLTSTVLGVCLLVTLVLWLFSVGIEAVLKFLLGGA